MLSILIPVYCFDVRPLVKDLLTQSRALTLPTEIILLDDGSPCSIRKINRELRNLDGVVYEELSENIGRSAIRNRLAGRAKYDYLLFLDNDSGIIRDDFLMAYVSHLSSNTVLVGGRTYPASCPNEKYRLHWQYGKDRESRSVQERAVKPYISFMTNNYVIPRAVQVKYRFDEQIKMYGHEDTQLGQQLKQSGIAIQHIDNPIVHLDLETTDVFLQKSKTAIDNLIELEKRGIQMDTGLLRIYRMLQRYKLDCTVLWLLNHRIDILKKDLYSQQPSLRAFDLFKLHYLLTQLEE